MNATGKFSLPKTLPQKEIMRKQASKDNLRRASSRIEYLKQRKRLREQLWHYHTTLLLFQNLPKTCDASSQDKGTPVPRWIIQKPTPGPVTLGLNVSLTPQALKTLPRGSGGRGPSSNYSPATKAILRSPPNGSAERNGQFGKTDKRNLYDEFQDGDPFSSEDRKPVPSRRTRDLGDQAVSSDTSGTEDSDIDSEDYGIDKRNSSAKHQIEDELALGEASAKIAAACARFPKFMAALDEEHGVHERGSISEFNPLVVIAIAAACDLHMDALEHLRIAAEDEASLGGQLGVEIARILNSPST